jgi:hypothetical protein
MIDMRQHPRRRHQATLISKRIAIIIISLNLNIDHFDGALLLCRQTAPAGRRRKVAESLENFFVDQNAEPVARALVSPYHALILDPSLKFLPNGFWGCAFQAAVFDHHVGVALPDFVGGSVVQILGAGVVVCFFDFFEALVLNPLVEEFERERELSVRVGGVHCSPDGEAPEVQRDVSKWRFRKGDLRPLVRGY